MRMSIGSGADKMLIVAESEDAILQRRLESKKEAGGWVAGVRLELQGGCAGWLLCALHQPPCLSACVH